MTRERYLKGTSVAIAMNPATGAKKFESRTAQVANIEGSVNLGPIQGGEGNGLLINIPDSAGLKGSLEVAAFSISAIGMTIGSPVTYGGPSSITEPLTLGAGKVFTLSNAAVAIPGVSAAFAYVGSDPTPYAVSAGTFTYDAGTVGQTYCVKYFVNDATAEKITINSTYNPDVVTLIYEGPIFEAESGNIANTGIKVGKYMVVIPRAQFNGDPNISLSQTDPSKTTLNWSALGYEEAVAAGANCTNTDRRYAYMYVYIDDQKWYNLAKELVFIGGEGIACGTSETAAIAVKGITADGQLIQADPADLDYTLDPTSLGTISGGVFTAAANAGTGDLTVETKASTGVDLSTVPIPVVVS